MRLIHIINEASGPDTWPGCISPGYRRLGPAKLVQSAQAAKCICGDALAGFDIIDPYGRFKCDGEGAPQTLLMQWRRAQSAGAPLARVAQLRPQVEALIEIAKLGECAVKLGYPPEPPAEMSEQEWFDALLPVIAARLDYIEDGGSSRGITPSHYWARKYGITRRVEGVPAPGSPLDSEDIPAMFTVWAWLRANAGRVRNPVWLQYRGWTAVRDALGNIIRWEEGPDGKIEDAIAIAEQNEWALEMNCAPSSEDEKGWEDLEKALAAAGAVVA